MGSLFIRIWNGAFVVRAGVGGVIFVEEDFLSSRSEEGIEGFLFSFLMNLKSLYDNKFDANQSFRFFSSFPFRIH